MKWKKKPEPKVGDIKIVKSFAWVPTLVGEEWIWLEWFYTRYECVERVVEIGWEPVGETTKKSEVKKVEESWNWLK